MSFYQLAKALDFDSSQVHMGSCPNLKGVMPNVEGVAAHVKLKTHFSESTPVEILSEITLRKFAVSA